MRTTLDIDDDVLAAARELARRERKAVGLLISELARAGLRAAATVDAHTVNDAQARYGIDPVGSRGGVVTNAVIDRLRGEDSY
jgi:2-keto-4-pentenoate hydratase